MASFLLRVFCCLGKRPRDSNVLDERSRLIPVSTPDGETLTGAAPGPNARAAFDHVIFKERLGSIVRSKEGKMVNVTSPLPFNLHNKPRALIDIMTQGSYMSSSSRSASASTFHESQSPNHERHHPSRPPPLPRVHSGLRVAPLHSAPQSRSRSRSRTHSSALSEASSSKGIDGREEPGGEENSLEQPPAVFGVRLVRGYDTGYGLIGQRGRAKVKKETDSPRGEAAEAESLGLVGSAGAECGGPGITECERSPTTPNGLPPELDEDKRSPGPPPHPKLSISPASDTFEFRLQDVGALSASWGE